MIHIDKFGIKNFRIFDDENGFQEELSSINLLTGPNNSGKSSVIKALQMIKNSVELNQTPFDLDFTKQEHLLGDINNVLHNKKNNRLTISLPFPLLGIQSISISLSFEVPSEANSYKAKLRQIEVIDGEDNTTMFLFKYRNATEEEKKDSEVKFKVEVEEYENLKQNKPDDKNIFSFSGYLFPPFENKLESIIEWEINQGKLIKYLKELLVFYKQYLDGGWQKEDLLKLDDKFKKDGFIPTVFIKSFKDKVDIEIWDKFIKEKSEKDDIIRGNEEIGERDFEPEEPYYPSFSVEYLFYYKSLEIIKNKLKWEDSEKENDWKYSVSQYIFESQWKILSEKLCSISYLTNIREENARIYNASSNTAFIKLLKEFDTSERPVKQFITKYLKSFEIGKKVNINHMPKYQLISVSITTLDNNKRELVDFGYGIKQLIIVLIQISVLAAKNIRMIEGYNEDGEYTYDYYEPSILLIEEPETNLHPKWQSLLADMFYEAYDKFNIQLVIETHSEYLIRRFQNLVAKNQIDREEIKIFYLRPSNNTTNTKKQIETINIEQDGTINYQAFDTGFFDESYNLEHSLLNIKFENQFQELKKSNDENENKIFELEQKIDDFTEKLDIQKYQAAIENRFDTTKLQSLSVRYLASGQLLLNTIDGNSDFSPCILQYGRTIEYELKQIFTAIGITDIKILMLGKFQGALEKFKTGTSVQSTYSSSVLSLLPTELNNRFNNPTNLKIELLNDIRETRNASGHSGQTKTKQEAIDYIDKVNDFLAKWISEMK